MTREYEQPLRYCDHCGIEAEYARCSVCRGPTRAADDEPLDYDRLRDVRNEVATALAKDKIATLNKEQSNDLPRTALCPWTI